MLSRGDSFEVEPYLLRPEAFEHMAGFPGIGRDYHGLGDVMLAHARAATVAAPLDSAPDISVILRVNNNPAMVEQTAATVQTLARHYAGGVELVVADVQSSASNRIKDITTSNGGLFVDTGSQAEFTYPRSLNIPIARMGGQYALLLTGPEVVTSHALNGVARWHSKTGNLGMVSGVALPSASATAGDMLTHQLRRSAERARRPAAVLDAWENGVGVAHMSVISKAAWGEVGGYNPNKTTGGEDTDLAKRLFLRGITVVRDPAIAVHYGKEESIPGALRRAYTNFQLRRNS